MSYDNYSTGNKKLDDAVEYMKNRMENGRVDYTRAATDAAQHFGVGEKELKESFNSRF